MAASGPLSTVTSTTVPLALGAWEPTWVQDGNGALGVVVVMQSDLQHGGAEVGLQLRRSSFGDHSPVVDDRQLAGEAVGLFEVLGGEEDGGAAVDQALDHLPQVVAALGVEAGGGLVEEQHGGSRHQGGSQVEAPPHAAGVRLEWPIAGVAELELFEQIVSSADHRLLGQVVEPSHHGQVLPTGEVLVDGGILPGQPDHGADERGFSRDVMTEDPCHSAVGLQDGGEDADGRGLAGTVGSQQTEDRPFFDGEADPVEGTYLWLAGKGLTEIVCLDSVGHGFPSASSGLGSWCAATDRLFVQEQLAWRRCGNTFTSSYLND